jgi:hypothetical protein
VVRTSLFHSENTGSSPVKNKIMMKLNLVIKYLLSCNSVVLFIITLELVEFIGVLISLLYFSLMYYNHIITAKLKYHFKQLPIYNKILVIWFSIFYAIPNKIFVSNNLSKVSITFFIFLIIVLSNVFIPLILLYIIFWINILESYFFAMFYENNVSFRKFVNNKLFQGNDEFAKEYFSFFWGNMNSGGAGKARAGVVGTLLSGLFQLARNQEKTHVRVQGQIETQTFIRNAVQKPQTPEEALAIQKKVENHIIERDTVILKVEKQFSDLGQKAFDWYNNS